MTTLHVARFSSPVGELQAASTDVGLAFLALPRASGRGLAGWQRRHAPDARQVKDDAPNRVAIEQVLEFLEGDRQVFDLPLDLRGTPFQISVYQDVASIPYGEMRSYADVASRVGRPSAVRAVGAANGANPVPLVIPCHRVVASNGHLQGYAGGLPLKAKLLAMESNAHPAQGALF